MGLPRSLLNSKPTDDIGGYVIPKWLANVKESGGWQSNMLIFLFYYFADEPLCCCFTLHSCELTVEYLHHIAVSVRDVSKLAFAFDSVRISNV